MTQQTATVWTVAVVGDNSALAQYAEHMRKSKAIADLVDCTYNTMLDWFYIAEGVKVSERYIGQEAYYAGAKRDDLTTAEMRYGFDSAFAAMQKDEARYQALTDTYLQDEPGYRASWHTY